MEQNYVTYRGDTFPLGLTFKDASGVAQSITGWTIFFTLKKSKEDTDENATIKKDITDHTNAEGGITGITLTAEETAELLGAYYYDIQYKDTNDMVKTIMEGTITFKADTTRRTTVTLNE